MSVNEIGKVASKSKKSHNTLVQETAPREEGGCEHVPYTTAQDK